MAVTFVLPAKKSWVLGTIASEKQRDTAHGISGRRSKASLRTRGQQNCRSTRGRRKSVWPVSKNYSTRWILRAAACGRQFVEYRTLPFRERAPPPQYVT